MKLCGKVLLTLLSCILTLAFVMATPSRAVAQDSEREFIYTVDFGDRTLDAFSFDLDTGKVRKVPGSPFAAGVGPIDLRHSPDGRFVYVVTNSQFLGGPCGANNGELISYSVNPRTGVLTQIDDVVLSGICSTAIAIDATGKFVYAASFPPDGPAAGLVDGFQTSNGHLLPLPGTPFVTPSAPVNLAPSAVIGEMAIPPDGKVLYASNPTDPGAFFIFDRDAETGTLAFRTLVDTGSALGPIAVTPSGRFLLAMEASPSGVDGVPPLFEFAIGKHGNLAPVAGSPLDTPNNSGSNMAISPDGDFVAVVFGGITMFRKDAHGKLSLVPGSPFGDSHEVEVAFDPSGRFLIVPGTVFRVHPQTGAISQVSNFVVAGGDAITVLRTCVDSDDDNDRDDKRNHDDRDSGCRERHGERE